MNTGHNVSLTALRTFPMFHGLTDEKLQGVSRCAVMRRVARGATVVSAGDRTDYVYFVLTGTLKVLVSDEDGREVILTLIGQGDLFGEMGVIDEEPRSATVMALTPADLIMISKADFRHILEEHFEVSLHLMRNLARRLRVADRKIESLALMDVYGRVARLLLDMAAEEGGGRIVRRKVSKQDIAKMIGASREMVSRVMKDLQTQELIRDTDEGILLCERIEQL